MKTCPHGHTMSEANTYTKRRDRATECRTCRKDQATRHRQDNFRGKNSQWAINLRRLNEAEIVVEKVTGCPVCPPSRYTGKRVPMVDDEDGGVKCRDCKRGPRVTIVFGEVS